MLYCYWDAFTVSLSFCFDTWCLKPALDNNAGSLPDICGEIVRCEGGALPPVPYIMFLAGYCRSPQTTRRQAH